MTGERQQQRPSIENSIKRRWWDLVKANWMAHLPTFQRPGPTPFGLHDLPTLEQVVRLGTQRAISQDDAAVRRHLLAEGMFLFHKCAHAHLAAHRLGTRGMFSWSMFNAYHAAFLGAHGVMALLGIATPQFDSHQYLIDAFPQPAATKGKRLLATGQWRFEVYDVVHFGKSLFKQEEIWEAFLRTIRVSVVPCWNSETVYEELRTLSNKGITHPRNLFLYSPTHWPLADLLEDSSAVAFGDLFGSQLSTQEQGFLLRLGSNVYKLFEALIADLAKASDEIRLELESSRIAKDPNVADLVAYNAFLASPPSLGTGL